MELKLSQCRIIELPKIADPRGNLTFLEGDRHLPFQIKRVFYLYDVPGGADRSDGVEVARLAGLPDSVVGRAREILRELETAAAPAPEHAPPEPEVQLGLFGPPVHPALDRLRGVDVNRLTPLQALNLLAELADAARQ